MKIEWKQWNFRFGPFFRTTFICESDAGDPSGEKTPTYFMRIIQDCGKKD